MNRQFIHNNFKFLVTAAVCSCANNICLAQYATPLEPTPVEPATGSSTTTTTTTTTQQQKEKHHHDPGLVPDTLGVTGKVVKETVCLPGRVVKETFKFLF